MIVDILANSERIEGLNLYFKMVFDYIKTHDLSSMPAGRIDIDGDNAYLKIEDAKGRRVEEAVYERHDKYIDIQMPLSMSESYGWKAKVCWVKNGPRMMSRVILLFTGIRWRWCSRYLPVSS